MTAPLDIAPIASPVAFDLENVRRRFAANAFAHIDGLWGEDVAAALRSDAEDRFEAATMNFAAGYAAQEGGGFSGPVLYSWASGGAFLQALQSSATLRTIASSIAGREVAPVHNAYLYYRPGNFCGLHTDRSDFQIQFLIRVLGDMGAIRIFPDLGKEWSTEALRDLCAGSGVPDGGVEVRYPRLGVTVFSGVDVPHCRPAHRANELGAVASLCYAAP